ncbi:MAG: hypothetical protein ACI3ZP_09050, partial [Candidatus Cryptobacteroides sp.]
MVFFEEVKEFVNASVPDAVCTSDRGFPLFTSARRPDTVIVAEPVKALTLEDAVMQSQGLSGLVTGLSGKKVVIVPEDVWRSRPEMLRLRLLAHLGKFRSVFARKTI